MHYLDALVLQRPVIIGLAILGAVLATVGNVILRKHADTTNRLGRGILRLGYGFAWLSVALFIIAGFRS